MLIYRMLAKVEQVMHKSMRSFGAVFHPADLVQGGQAGGTDIHEFRALSQHALRGLPQEEKRGTSPLVTKG